nr:biotin--[acetyl-CoA-carboxylase] ligase [Pseudenhygromyxa sp. WMMC2535]
MTTRRLGRVHEHHASIASTNDRALAWLGDASAPAPDGALVSADAQTAGRGRRGRAWVSPPGEDLYASVILRPGAPAAGFEAVALAVGVGLREGLLRALAGANTHGLPIAASELTLKWPNDLLLGGRKLAGILCESRVRGREIELVIGFGVNVQRRRFPPELDGLATSLALTLAPLERAQVPGRAELLAAILHELEAVLERFFVGGFPAIRPRYEPHCLVLGRSVAIEDPDGVRRPATALGLDHDGALRVRDHAGVERRVESADVWLAEPAPAPEPAREPTPEPTPAGDR